MNRKRQSIHLAITVTGLLAIVVGTVVYFRLSYTPQFIKRQVSGNQYVATATYKGLGMLPVYGILGKKLDNVTVRFSSYTLKCSDFSSDGACSLIWVCNDGRVFFEGELYLLKRDFDVSVGIPIPDTGTIIEGAFFDENGELQSRIKNGNGEAAYTACSGEKLICVVENSKIVHQKVLD